MPATFAPGSESIDEQSGGNMDQNRNEWLEAGREPRRQLELYSRLLRGCTDTLAVLLIKDIVAELEHQLGNEFVELASDQL